MDSRDEVALELRDDRKQLWRLRMKDPKARAELLRRYPSRFTAEGLGFRVSSLKFVLRARVRWLS